MYIRPLIYSSCTLFFLRSVVCNKRVCIQLTSLSPCSNLNHNRKVLGYGLLYGPDERHKKVPARYVLSTALCTVAEKKGIKSHCLTKPGRGER